MLIAALTTPLQAGEIVFVRHGETEANRSGRYVASTTNRLTATGRRQADALPEILRGDHFDYAATSPLSRCIQTIIPLLQAKRMRAAVWPELGEISRNVLSGKSNGRPKRGGKIEIPQAFKRYFFFERRQDNRALEPGGRGAALRQIRAAAAKLRALARPDKARILVVGHSINGSALLNTILGRDPDRSLPLLNGRPARMRVGTDGKAELLELNGKSLPCHAQ